MVQHVCVRVYVSVTSRLKCVAAFGGELCYKGVIFMHSGDIVRTEYRMALLYIVHMHSQCISHSHAGTVSFGGSLTSRCLTTDLTLISPKRLVPPVASYIRMYPTS